MAHRIQIHIIRNGNLGPMLVDLAAAPLLFYSDSWVCCILAARPSSGLATVALLLLLEGLVAALPQETLGFSGLLSSQPRLMPAPCSGDFDSGGIVRLHQCCELLEAAEQGSHSCSAVWVT